MAIYKKKEVYLMLKKVFLLVILVNMGGCAFSVYDVNVDYKYQDSVDVELSSVSLAVGEIADSRDAINPRMIMNQKNGYGQTTSGGWQAEKPLNEITRDAIIDGLMAAKANISPQSKIELTGELLGFESDVIMGVWEGTFKGKITVKLQITDSESGVILWRDTFIGSGEVKGGNGVVGSLKVALDELVTNLINDEYFLQQLRR